MKLTYIGHACALIEHKGKRLLMDPWLDGPVYWGAWWHFPRAKFNPDIFDVDYIYISHWHFDHLHMESMQRFNKNVHLILPKFPVSGLPEPLLQMGFSKLTELPTGETFELAPGFRLSSFQVQMQDDSAAVVECDVPGRVDPVVVINLNDAKPLPSTWRRINSQFPKIEMMLRSHSPAWSHPTAFTFEDQREAIQVSKETYKEAFWSAAEKLRPKYAVAFASGVCHLSDDTLFENDNLVLGGELLDYFALHPMAGVQARYAEPGSIYEPATGFSPRSVPPSRADLQQFVQDERAEQAGRLQQIETEIDGKALKLEKFDEYFRQVRWKSLPLWFVMKGCWRFDLNSPAGPRTLWFDFNANRSYGTEPQAAVTARFWVKEGILAEALETMTFSNIDVSKRWKVWLAKGQVTKYFLINTFFGLTEAGYLRWGNLLNLRLWLGLVKRRDELFDYAMIALRLALGGRDAVLATTVEGPAARKT